MVPVFVNTNDGQPVFDLKRNDFVLTDNGNPQLVTLEEDNIRSRWPWQSWLRLAELGQGILRTIRNEQFVLLTRWSAM